MSISYRDVGELRTIMLAGRMDVAGWDAVASQLVDLTQAQSRVVLDLTALPMLASIGIRAISVSAKDSSSTVMTTLKLTGLEQLVPIFRRPRDAEQAVQAG
jgi:anti-anti-sigma regulatory factor